MAKEIKFNIRLSIEGKEQVVTATSDIKERVVICSKFAIFAVEMTTS